MLSRSAGVSSSYLATDRIGTLFTREINDPLQYPSCSAGVHLRARNRSETKQNKTNAFFFFLLSLVSPANKPESVCPEQYSTGNKYTRYFGILKRHTSPAQASPDDLYGLQRGEKKYRAGCRRGHGSKLHLKKTYIYTGYALPDLP